MKKTLPIKGALHENTRRYKSILEKLDSQLVLIVSIKYNSKGIDSKYFAFLINVYTWFRRALYIHRGQQFP